MPGAGHARAGRNNLKHGETACPRRFSASKKWQMPLFRGSKFGQPEVARICKELILQAKSTTREAGKAGLHEEKSEGLRPLRHLLKVF